MFPADDELDAWLRSDEVWTLYLAAVRRQDYQFSEGEVCQLGLSLGLHVTMFRAPVERRGVVPTLFRTVIGGGECPQGKSMQGKSAGQRTGRKRGREESRAAGLPLICS